MALGSGQNLNSNNEHLNTLSMSFDFYMALTSNAAGSIRAKVDNEDALNALAKIELMLNYLLVSKLASHHKDLVSHCGVAVDWSQFFSYFNLLDALILQSYSSDEWDRCQKILMFHITKTEIFQSAMMTYSHVEPGSYPHNAQFG
jgi:hypothetical protein